MAQGSRWKFADSEVYAISTAATSHRVLRCQCRVLALEHSNDDVTRGYKGRHRVDEVELRDAARAIWRTANLAVLHCVTICRTVATVTRAAAHLGGSETYLTRSWASSQCCTVLM